MNKLKMHCLVPQSVFPNTFCVLFLLMAVLLVASPALAVDLDVQNTKVTLGGYIKLQMIYDSDGSTDGAPGYAGPAGHSTNAEGAPMDGDVAGGYDVVLDDDASGYDDKEDFRMTARESRLFVKTKTDTDGGVVSTHFEGDFFGNAVADSGTWSNSSTFRIRHAYGSYASGSNEILAGQTWSTFMDLAAGVPDMDISGDPGFCFVRQPQVRYQHNLRPGHYIAFALENPDRGFTPPGTFVNAGDSDEKLPDFVAKYFYATKMFTLSPRIVLRQFDLTDSTTEESQTATGWGVGLSGSVKTGPVRFALTFMYGDGIGRYSSLGNIAGAGLTADGSEIKTVKFSSINGGMTFAFSPAVSWTIGAGIAENSDDDVYDVSNPILLGSATKKAAGYHTNLKWKVAKGFEWAIGAGMYEREVMDGRDGSMTRFQSYFKYDF